MTSYADHGEPEWDGYNTVAEKNYVTFLLLCTMYTNIYKLFGGIKCTLYI